MTQQEKSSNTGRRITGNESTREYRMYYRSTPVARAEQVSRHINSYTSTYKQNNVQRSTQDTNNTWKDRHSFTYVSRQKLRNELTRRHINSNRPTHKSENNEQGRHTFYERSTRKAIYVDTVRKI